MNQPGSTQSSLSCTDKKNQSFECSCLQRLAQFIEDFLLYHNKKMSKEKCCSAAQ